MSKSLTIDLAHTLTLTQSQTPIRIINLKLILNANHVTAKQLKRKSTQRNKNRVKNQSGKKNKSHIIKKHAYNTHFLLRIEPKRFNNPRCFWKSGAIQDLTYSSFKEKMETERENIL